MPASKKEPCLCQAIGGLLDLNETYIEISPCLGDKIRILITLIGAPF